jgi:hypothetical protein
MSVFNRASVTCSVCGQVTEGEVAGSVNADRRPDLRGAILDRRFQLVSCASCKANLRLPPGMTYMDMGRQQWMIAYPVDFVAQWREKESIAQDVFTRGFGLGAPAAARALGISLVPRIAFGWPAIREKILCRALERDDVTLELLKLLVIRTIPNPPFSDATELRLESADDEAVVLAWSAKATEAILTTVRVPWSAYDAIVEDEAGWAELRAGFESAMFVDIARLLID